MEAEWDGLSECSAINVMSLQFHMHKQEPKRKAGTNVTVRCCVAVPTKCLCFGNML